MINYVYEIILHPSGKPKFNNEEKTLKLVQNQNTINVSSLFYFEWYKIHRATFLM